MTDINALQSIESLKVLLYIITAVLIVSVAIIGYFLSKRDEAITKRDEAMVAATENLTSAVQQLKTIVNSLQLQHDIRQPIIDSALEMHRQAIEASSEIFKKMDARLIKLETEHKMFHCNYEVSKRKIKKDENTD